MTPRITVLMPVYNCQAYIEESVNSILNQTFSDFELIIIDDASTDNTVEILKTYIDPRIHLIIKPINKGYTDSLNSGLKLAKGEYIARMDGDDISLPDRFAKQIAFLDSNPDVILCGTRTRIIGTDRIFYVPDEHEKIKINLIMGFGISHPTVMMRNSAMEKYQLEYNPEMEPAEDYDLWTRMVFCGKLANLNEVLLLYRVHHNQTSSVRKQLQMENTRKIKLRMLQYLIPTIPVEYELFELKNNVEKNQLSSRKLRKRLKEKLVYMNNLAIENNIKKIYDPKLFVTFIKARKADLPSLFLRESATTPLKKIIDVLIFMPYFCWDMGLKGSIKYIVKNVLKMIHLK